MSLGPQLPPEVARALDRGWTVVTGNQRAARTLRQAYNAQKVSDGAPGWQPPEVLAWDTWLALLWRGLVVEGRAFALLLNPHQEHAIWRRIVLEDVEMVPTLRPPDSLADLAASGWELLNRFGARTQLRRHADTADTQAFVRWATQFEVKAAREGLLSRARLPDMLREALGKASAAAEALQGVLLVGFDRKTPDQEALLSALREAGIPLQELGSEDPAASARLVSAATEQAELEGCAQWARKLLAARPEARVAVIVPGLADLRMRIDRTFRRIVAPELEDIAAPADIAPWEFSLGVALSSTALVSAAIDLLQWAVGPLPVERASRLLLSPYFAGGSEYVARAEFDAFVLRRETGLLPEVTSQELLRLAARSARPAEISELVRYGHGAQRVLERTKPTEGGRSYAAWCAVFGQLLDAWGWTTGQQDGSVEFQTRRRWAGVLDDLASLDFEGRPVSYATALKELRRLAAKTLFAARSQDAPIQVMGPLEAAGAHFDAVWFLRAGDLSWPAGVGPHPLLPLRLQRELGMPGADPTQETEHARGVARRMAASAGTVIFSYARETADSHQRPSPALRNLRLEAVELEALVETPATRRPVLLERSEDKDALPDLPDRVVRGGSQILQLQAACGFRAFAEMRLHSAGLHAAEAGLDAMERGNLVHKVLEAVWAELGTQQALKALSGTERRALLAHCIDEAMERARRGSAAAWPAAYLDIERERLLRLLGVWLEKELERAPFAVALREQRVEDVAIGPLRVEMRLDRVDVLLRNGEPAGEIVLDYKTGSVKTADWMGERPDDPQVPLYALVRKPESLVGVAFGAVRPGKTMGLSGLQIEAGVLPGRTRTVDLRTQIEQWRDVVTALAEEYAAGNAPVSPKQYPSTCRYCEQRLLCRLDPKTLEPESLEDLADPDWTESEAENA